MSEVVEHYLLRLTREEPEDEGERPSGRASGWRISLRSIKDGSLVDFEEPAQLLEYLDTQVNARPDQVLEEPKA